MRGFDQLSAKFTGTSIRVTPGAHNLGLFINLKRRDNEEYQLTHPTAHLGGMLRGSLSVTVSDQCYVVCPKTKMKVIMHYQEESWLGKTQNKVSGVVYTYDPENDTKSRLKDVSEKDVLARVEGSWHDQVYYTLAGSKVTLLFHLRCGRADLSMGTQTSSRPQTALPPTKNTPSTRQTTPQRVATLLGLRYRRNKRQTIQ